MLFVSEESLLYLGESKANCYLEKKSEAETFPPKRWRTRPIVSVAEAVLVWRESNTYYSQSVLHGVRIVFAFNNSNDLQHDHEYIMNA